jgi:hypothetical protein
MEGGGGAEAGLGTTHFQRVMPAITLGQAQDIEFHRSQCSRQDRHNEHRRSKLPLNAFSTTTFLRFAAMAIVRPNVALYCLCWRFHKVPQRR